MRIPFVLLDAHGEPVGPGVLTPDRRGRGHVDEARRALGGDELHALTGHWAGERFGLPKLLWFPRERPDLWRRVRHVLQLHDWVLYRLSGEIASEPSSASMGQLVDVRARTWATPLLTALGLDPARFPPLLDGGTPVGTLRADVAEAIGVRAGTPVHVGGGDTHLCALAADAAVEGTVVAVGGSTTPVQLTTSAFPRNGARQAVVSAHVLPGLLAVEANTGPSGTTYRWLRDLVGEAGSLGYASLDRLAAAAPRGARGVLATASAPRFGEEAWSRLAPATLFGVSDEQSLGDVARGNHESVCYAVAGNVEQVDAVRGAPVERLVLTGGASLSALWPQLMADVLGRPVDAVQLSQPAAVAGARLVLGEGAGAPAPRVAYEPDPEAHEEYRAHRVRYAAVFEGLREAFGE
jgi:sugar (pentulose or hexulose) kinase